MFLKMNYTVLVQKVPLSVCSIYVSIEPAINQCRCSAIPAAQLSGAASYLLCEAETGCFVFTAITGHVRPPDEQTWGGKNITKMHMLSFPKILQDT